MKGVVAFAHACTYNTKQWPLRAGSRFRGCAAAASKGAHHDSTAWHRSGTAAVEGTHYDAPPAWDGRGRAWWRIANCSSKPSWRADTVVDVGRQPATVTNADQNRAHTHPLVHVRISCSRPLRRAADSNYRISSGSQRNRIDCCARSTLPWKDG